MTEEEKTEVEQFAQWINGFHGKKGATDVFLAEIAISLFRIARAQEAVVELAQADLEESVNAAVEERAQILAEKLDEDKTRRSFIGKRP